MFDAATAALPHRLAVDPFDASAGIDERILRRVLEEVADVSVDERSSVFVHLEWFLRDAYG